MAWLQLRVYTRHPEFADELLTAYDAAAISFIDGEDSPILEPLPGETPFWPDTVTLALFPEHHDVSTVIAELRNTLPEGEALRIDTALIEDQDWVRVWLEHWPPMQFGPKFWVCPREKRAEITDAEATVLLLDPGLAFGTGTHPSTALCLEWLATADLRDKTVLDFGCGSGILAIAALLLGAKSAVCVDIDPQALTATLDNATVNGVADRIQMCLPSDFEARAFDVVLANILANPLIQLAPLLAQCSKLGGSITMAGLLERQADEVRSAYAPWFAFSEDGRKEGWNRLNGQCHMPALLNRHRIHDKLLTAGQPQRPHFAMLAKTGIQAVVNLAMPTSPGFLADEREIVEALGLRYTHIPVLWDSPTHENFQQFCAVLDAHAAEHTLVHCAANKRVSAMIYLYRTRYRGEDTVAAQADLAALWTPNETWARFIAAEQKNILV